MSRSTGKKHAKKKRALTEWEESCLDRLPKFLDANGDLAPPWERFPTYERYTIGWRMGVGEDWLGMWHVFLNQFDTTERRFAYLRRHPPAPVTWAETVYNVLHPRSRNAERKGDDRLAAKRRKALLRAGLIASDIAYSTWLSQQSTVWWIWDRVPTPKKAARYWIRPFWFWSRQVDGLRSRPGWKPPAVPTRWKSCAAALRTGSAGAVDHRKGLLSLARMLAAGRVTPPWHLGLNLRDFANTFEEDMGFVDAFRNWGMSAFDDREHLERYLAANEAPKVWRRWSAEQFLVDTYEPQ